MASFRLSASRRFSNGVLIAAEMYVRFTGVLADLCALPADRPALEAAICTGAVDVEAIGWASVSIFDIFDVVVAR